MSTRVTMRVLCLAAVFGALGCSSLREWTRETASRLPGMWTREGRIVGRVFVEDGGEALGRAAVYLAPIDGTSASKPPADAVVRERGAGLEPDFVVVAVGQPVQFVNQDTIFHGVFSYSRPNRFSRRPFAPGQTRSITFKHPGVVNVYCPLHSQLPGLVLVVPDTHFAVLNPRGDFQMEGVPAGRYRLSLWSELHGVADREVSLEAGEVKRVDLTPHSKP